MNIRQVPLTQVLPLLAQLYGAPEGDLQGTLAPDSSGWLAVNGAEVLGAVGLRPATPHGAELMGGAFPGPHWAEVALALGQAAQQEVGRVYVFADGRLFPYAELLNAGWREVGAYRRLEGRPPYLLVETPAGLRIVPMAEVQDLNVRVQAMQTYQDQIGHHTATPEAAAADFGGCDTSLSQFAVDDAGNGIGLCCVTLDGQTANVGAPGVHPTWRHTNLRAALWSAVGQALRAQGTKQIGVDSWGDTPESLAADLQLGLKIMDETPMLALG